VLFRSRITPELIDYVVAKIVQEVTPQRIILFGSYARDEATEHSDLDLFIIHDSEESDREVRRRIDHLLWGRRFGRQETWRNSA
jgi:predicted nucleotidyltransferase